MALDPGHIGLSDFVKVASTNQVAGNINDRLASGVGVVLDDAEYEIESPILVPSQAIMRGFSTSRTVIKVPIGGNFDAVKTDNFDAMTDSGLWSVPEGVRYGFALSDFTVDGNNGNIDEGGSGSMSEGTNQTSGRGIALFAKNYWMRDIVITQTKDEGLWTECGPFDSAQYNSFDIERPEPSMDRVYVGYCGGVGWRHRGPQDFEVGTMILGRNNWSAGCVLEGAGADNYRGGCTINKLHEYSGHRGCVFNSAGIHVMYLYADFSDPALQFGSDAQDIYIGHLRGLQPGERPVSRSNYPDGNNGTLLFTAAGGSNIIIDNIQCNWVTEQEATAVGIDIVSGVVDMRINNAYLDGPAAGAGIGLRIASPGMYRGVRVKGWSAGTAIQVASGAADEMEIEATVEDATTALDWNDAGTATNAEVKLKAHAAVTTAVSGTIGAGAYTRINDGGVVT